MSCDVSLSPPSPKIPQSFAVSGVGRLCTQTCVSPAQQGRMGREWEKPAELACSRILFFFFNLPPVERPILNSLGITGIILKEALEGQE